MPTSQFFWNEEKKVFEVEITNRKGETKKLVCDAAELSAELPKTLPEEPMEVEFERDLHGKPLKVRLVGKEWMGAQKKSTQVDYSKKNLVPSSDKSKFAKVRDFRPNPPQGEVQTMKGEFHNPYNFVPAPPRVLEGELGDREPSGHDRYHTDKFSGKLCVKMRVETPLLLPDTARMHYDNEHKSFHVCVDADGKPFINPTAIKGMLRSAYEAITNSRLSVFQKHNERLAFRGEAITPIAARIEMHKGSLHIRRFYQVAAVLVRYRKHWKGEKDKLERDDKTKTPTLQGRSMTFSSSTDLPQHGQPVWVRISDRISHKGRTKGNIIGKIIDEIQARTSGSIAPTGFVAGWACIMGANAKDKVYERVFVESKSDDAFLPVTEDHIQSWKELISNYQKTHEEDLKKRKKNRPPQQPTDYLGNNPGETAWSRQIYDERYTKLEEGTLCYLVEEAGLIKSLIPVMISRRLHGVSPDKLLPDCLKPVSLIGEAKDKDGTYLSEMSPAGRVFGCVRQKRKDEKGKDKNFKGNIAGYRGQVRIGVVNCISDKAKTIEYFQGTLPLQILGQPKPQQGRFYVAETQNGEAQTHKGNNENAGFQEGRGLRGRKVYPHHNVPKDYWKPKWANSSIEENGTTYFQEYRRPDGQKQRDSQNRSIQGWVTPNTEFTFDIHFTNLSGVELGALIWLLDLPEKHFHRFGGGKPLGFGSVELELIKDKSEILNGKEIRENYLSLDYKPINSITPEKCKDEFISAVKSAYPKTKLLEAFEQSAKGFDDNLPTHYPRTRHYKLIEDNQGNKSPEFINKEDEPLPPHEEGLAYEWFVANNQMQGRQIKYGFVLPNLIDEKGKPDGGLKILSSEVKERAQGNRNQNRNQQSDRNRGGGRR